MTFIYFDNNATTAVDPRVVDAMLPYLREKYGNPSSGHLAGREAKAGLTLAREQVASLLGCEPEEIVFTGGASEANNFCIKGTVLHAHARSQTKLTLLRSDVEHASVKGSMQFLNDFFGASVQSFGVDENCVVRLEQMSDALKAKPFLLSCMAAQNEVGTLQPLSEVVSRVRGLSPHTLIHVDAAQAAGKVPFNVKALGVDLAVIASQKFHGPKGVAAAYVRKGVDLVSLVHGVAHERGLRAGTENVAGIVGLGAACELARLEMAASAKKVTDMRERLFSKLRVAIPNIRLNGHPSQRLPGTLNVTFPGLNTNALLAELSNVVAASNGAACHSGSTTPSQVLLAMGISREDALGAVRLSLSKFTTDEEIEAGANAIITAARKLCSNLSS